MNRKVITSLIVTLFFNNPVYSFAATSGPSMPWDGPLTTVLNSLTGTVAHLLITAAVVATGLLFAFSEAGMGARKVFGVALGGALALGAISFMTAIGLSGAVF